MNLIVGSRTGEYALENHVGHLEKVKRILPSVEDCESAICRVWLIGA